MCVAMKQEGKDLFVYFFQRGTKVIFAVTEIFYIIIVVLFIQLYNLPKLIEIGT